MLSGFAQRASFNGRILGSFATTFAVGFIFVAQDLIPQAPHTQAGPPRIPHHALLAAFQSPLPTRRSSRITLATSHRWLAPKRLTSPHTRYPPNYPPILTNAPPARAPAPNRSSWDSRRSRGRRRYLPLELRLELWLTYQGYALLAGAAQVLRYTVLCG